ncbi:MAG TPA: hypothetical protein VJK03_00645 [Candidatus Nanoarchaeia archaeon]|nr:hypothetical protein [Candidatus Nanoarchaeia archaeon]
MRKEHFLSIEGLSVGRYFSYVTKQPTKEQAEAEASILGSKLLANFIV